MSIYGAEQRMRIDRIKRDGRYSLAARKLNVWNYILTHELQVGSSWVHAQPGGQLYLLAGESNEVIKISMSPGAAWSAYLNTVYGIVGDDPYAPTVHKMAHAYVQRQGLKAEVRRFSAYDRTTNTGYISNYAGRAWKINGPTITTVQNGEDNIFFANDDGGIPVDDDVEIGPHGILLDRLTSPNFATSGLSGITAEQQRKALIVWLFALGLPDLLPHKPILLVEGAFGAGKTSVVTLIQLALMGNKDPMLLQRNKEDDFGVVLLRSPIALFDNTDSYIDWVPDAIAAYATGGKWKKRKLFTDDDNLIIKPHAFVSVATRNPASFRRDDVADRCIILRLERWASFTPTSVLERAIIEQRPALLGEYLHTLGRIVELIRGRGFAIDNERFRMSDFAALARVVGAVLEWPEGSVDDMLSSLQGERDAFINEDDPLVDLLGLWVGYKSKFAPSNIGRLVTGPQLHSELETFAQGNNVAWKDSPRTLAQKLRSTHIEREFRIEITTLHSQKHYQIWRHSDARLELVPDSSTEIEQ